MSEERGRVPDLAARAALVTGGSRGIGRAVALELASHGAAVVVNYYQSQDLAEQVAAEINDKGGQAIVVQAGVAHTDEVQRLVQTTVEKLGRIDILVNNAGVNRDRTIRRMSPEEWREVLSTDLDSVYYCTAAVIPHMVENGGGKIVNISSIIGQIDRKSVV